MSYPSITKTGSKVLVVLTVWPYRYKVVAMSVFPYEHVRPLALLKKTYNFFIVRKKQKILI